MNNNIPKELNDRQRALVLEHQRLVDYVAKPYRHLPIDAFEDLTSKLMLRLCQSIQSFDESRGIKISSYIVESLKGEVRHYFRDDVWMVRPPRPIREKGFEGKVDTTEDKHKAKRFYIDEDIARSCMSPVSIDSPISGRHGEYRLDPPDQKPSVESQIVDVIGGNEVVRQVFSALCPDERYILSYQMEYGKEGLNVVQKYYGISNSQMKEVWEELQNKIKPLYQNALDDLPLEPSPENKALNAALRLQFIPEPQTFIEVRENITRKEE